MSGQLTLKQLTDLMIQDLARSGLTPTDGYFEPGTYAKRQGYFLHYPTIDGKKSDFFRFRFLDAAKGFDAMTKRAEQRYTQPAGMAPRAYFSTLCKWRKILADVSQRLLITEGEKKAACACKNDIPCIGLGGIWNFKPKGRQELITDLEQITWKDRVVIVVSDSDAATNEQVQYGADFLVTILRMHGARVNQLVLPEVD